MNDQARNLRLLAEERQRKLYSMDNDHHKIMVVSGKGGVGKSFLSLHLAQALAKQGERVLLVDSNLQSPNLHVLTNIDSEYPIHYWLEQNLPIEEKAVINLYKNLDVLTNTISAHPHNIEYLANAELFLELLTPLASKYSFVIMDTHTSLSEWNVSLLRYASLGLLLSISEPTSVIDTYTYIKASLPYLQKPNLQLIINQVIGKQNGIEAHQKLNQALKNFLNFQIELLGLISFDMDVKRSGMEQKPIWQLSGESIALWEIRELAQVVQSAIQQDVTEKQMIQEVNV